MTDVQRRIAAKEFAERWQHRGDEKSETQTFWHELLGEVLGVERPGDHIIFEKRVHTATDSSTTFIDGYIPEARVLIEQKSSDINLSQKHRQSDGEMLTPFDQANRYTLGLPASKRPLWIVVCNFDRFHIHDMEHPNAAPVELLLKDLPTRYHLLDFLVKKTETPMRHEMDISWKAGQIVGDLYDALLEQYVDKTNPESLRSLNMLCVRLVFCLYAEDTDLFGAHLKFHDYMENRGLAHARQALIDLFKVLDTPYERRDPYLDSDLAEFPYVNGGLFSDESIEIPRLNEKIFDLLVNKASAETDWSGISPTIFGAVFESTLSGETRHKGGMHYTSIENIHKVIDPLFLDELTSRFQAIKNTHAPRQKKDDLAKFHNDLASLKFMDPAAGSGNFLTESYLCLRRLENEVIAEEMMLRSVRNRDELTAGQIGLGGVEMLGENPIKVSIGQFYGIEIHDFAVAVAKTALWIAESQMMKKTEELLHAQMHFLPLKDYDNIRRGNALRMDWSTLVPRDELTYILGNPPFLGARVMTPEQKEDVIYVFGAKWPNVGNLDYVACWYKKAAEMTHDTRIRAALVSTNSITQGEAVANLWGPLAKSGVHIDFAHRTFQWGSEAADKAHVHCVIVGFSTAYNRKPKVIYDGDRAIQARNINAYLLDAPDVFVKSRNHPLCDVPEIGIGNKPIDGGNYLFTPGEMEDFIAREPLSAKYFRPWYGSEEFINGKKRFCLWLGDCPPSELRRMPLCLERVGAVVNVRLHSSSAGTQKLAARPTRFHVENMPSGTYIIIPRVSSERREYIPIGFLTPDILTSDSAHIIPDATLYHFGVLTSSAHMAWVRAVCGRLKSDYRYSKDVVYNNFPWPSPTSERQAKIEKTAQAILDARAMYPDASLADLYDKRTMPAVLLKAHEQNDRAVWEAYGRTWPFGNEATCVSELMRMYQTLVDEDE